MEEEKRTDWYHILMVIVLIVIVLVFQSKINKLESKMEENLVEQDYNTHQKLEDIKDSLKHLDDKIVENKESVIQVWLSLLTNESLEEIKKQEKEHEYAWTCLDQKSAWIDFRHENIGGGYAQFLVTPTEEGKGWLMISKNGSITCLQRTEHELNISDHIYTVGEVAPVNCKGLCGMPERPEPQINVTIEKKVIHHRNVTVLPNGTEVVTWWNETIIINKTRIIYPFEESEVGA